MIRRAPVVAAAAVIAPIALALGVASAAQADDPVPVTTTVPTTVETTVPSTSSTLPCVRWDHSDPSAYVEFCPINP